ncbi:MAG: SAF domain-containing protein [Micrococcales bacterium]|nr:SAF domain-containing protein [Micrococcales bacterium]
MLRKVAAAVAAGLAAYTLVVVLRPPPDPSLMPVAVAADTVPAGTPLRADLVEIQMIDRDQIPSGAVDSADELSGHRLTTPVTAGEILTRSRIVGEGLLVGASAGARAVRVPVVDAASLEMVSPGALVDVLAPGQPGPTLVAATVLDVQRGAPSSNPLDPAGGSPGVTLEVSASEAAQLAQAHDPGAPGGGGFLLALHPPG